MGRCRNIGRNIARYNLKMSRKRAEKANRKRKQQTLSLIDKAELQNAVAESSSTKAEDMVIEGIMGENKELEKKKPFVREEKLRRSELPLVSDGKRSTIKEPKVKKAKLAVVSARKLSKKKARKLMKVQRRGEREKEKQNAAMDTS